MPQVKIKQGSKSVVNNNAGVLNAGTLAVTTDTNELFFTHNDGTLHQLCDNVNKSGDTMTGNLNMSGNSFERARFEVVTSLPTANNFVGRQVTYQGRSYIWNGSGWDSQINEINTINNGFGETFCALENNLYTNILWCYDTSKLSFENSQDGVNFTTINPNLTQLKKVLTNYNPEAINCSLGTANAFRITIEAKADPYRVAPNYLVIKAISYINPTYIKIEGSTDGISWGTVINNLSWTGGYPGECCINTRSFGQFTHNTGFGRPFVRITFSYNTGVTWNFCLNTLRWYSKFNYTQDFATKNTPYDLDYDKNVYFPASVQSNETINFDTNNIEPTQTGTVTKTSTWTWQYLVQSMNYSWLKLKTWVGGLFSAGSATTNNNYLPKINDVDKKLVKSNIYDDGTTPKYGANTIWHSGNDGSGSGLDADLLDGQQGSYYLDWTNTTNKPDPTLTLTGDVTGSGTMTDLGNVSITTTVTDDSHNHSDTTITSLSGSKINSGTIGFSYLPTGTSGSTVAIGNHNHSGVYQPIDADLTAIAALSGTSGLLKKTAADTWSLDTTAYTTNTGTVTNIVTGNGLSGGPITTTGTINLATAYGDTVNPYASKTAKYVLAAPNAGDGVPTFRLLVASDIPTLNQNTTGSAGSVTSSITFNNGGAGDASETTYNGSTARTISYNTIGAAASSHTHSTYVNQTLTSGNGMAAWTATNGDLTVALGTPSPITGSSINEVTTTSHTHAISITPTDIGAATSAQGTKADSALQAIDKAMVENVLTGVITSHSHSGNDSGNDTKNTAGATNTSSKIYLVGSTDQTANPQTYTHDTAYVDVDGSVYSGSSKTITVSDLETNQIVTPTLNPTWTIKNYAGTVVSSPTNPSGDAISGTSIILEYGFKPSMTVKGKWIAQAGYDNPTSCSGLCGTSLPASNVETASTASIDLYNSTTYSSTVVPTTTSDYWTIFTPKKGITISGSSLVLPIGNISASARVQVTYQLPIYYGNVTSLTITEADVEALTTKTWKNYQASSKSISPTVNSSDSQYWIYAYPAAWGDLTTISNADGDWIAAFTSSTVNITGAPGLPVLYKYYITVNKGAFKNKTINFS